MKWIIKREETGWVPVCMTTALATAPGGKTRLVEGPQTQFPKVIFNGDDYEVTEDITAKEAYQIVLAEKESDRIIALQIKKELKTLLDDIDAATTLAQMKTIFKKIVRVFPYLLKELKDG